MSGNGIGTYILVGQICSPEKQKTPVNFECFLNAARHAGFFL
jgi:hypothetical protein